MNKEQIMEAIEKMTVLELSELVKALEEKFGVSASAPMAAAAPVAAAAAPVRSAGQKLCEHRLRLYRRAAPFGLCGGANRRGLAQRRIFAHCSSPEFGVSCRRNDRRPATTMTLAETSARRPVLYPNWSRFFT